MKVKSENDSAGYPSLKVELKTGAERFLLEGNELPVTLLDFWKWSASDLVNNALRGQLAEYIVAQALGITTSIRNEWDAYDMKTSRGTRVEVKSAAYLQSWYHKKLSNISFGIRPTLGWNAETNEYATAQKRQADVYVFCLLGHQDKNTVNPLNLDQWEFYVLATSVLDQACGSQKTITISKLQKLNPKHVKYEDLAFVIEEFTPSDSITVVT